MDGDILKGSSTVLFESSSPVSILFTIVPLSFSSLLPADLIGYNVGRGDAV